MLKDTAIENTYQIHHSSDNNNNKAIKMLNEQIAKTILRLTIRNACILLSSMDWLSHCYTLRRIDDDCWPIQMANQQKLI